MSSYCLFQEPWWLDTVAPGAWQSLEVWRGTEIAARLPIATQHLWGLKIIRQPPLTPTLGPWLRPSAAGQAKQLAEQKELFNALIDQLPRWDYCQLNFNHRLTNWLPFHWRGFKQTTRYTYILPDVSAIDRAWGELEGNARRQIRNAERSLVVRSDLSLDCFLNLVELTFRRQGRKLPFHPDVMRRIDHACGLRAARQLFFAQDAVGRVHATIYLVNDAHYVYYLLGGADPELRNSGAQYLLLWEAVKHASRLNVRLDLEGSMIEPIERVFRAMGAIQVPYLQVFGATRLVKALLLLRELAPS